MPALRTSHFPDPPRLSLEPRSRLRLGTEGSQIGVSAVVVAAQHDRRRVDDELWWRHRDAGSHPHGARLTLTAPASPSRRLARAGVVVADLALPDLAQSGVALPGVALPDLWLPRPRLARFGRP